MRRGATDATAATPGSLPRWSLTLRGKALAGKSTLNRLELTPAEATSESRYKKIVLDDERAADFFVETFISSHRKPPEEITLDLVQLLAVYIARGVHELQRGAVDRTSTHLLRSNQIRLWFSSVAYVLVEALRRVALAGTELARAQCGTIRTRLLKIGAQVKVTVRKVWVALAESCPWVGVFRAAWRNLQRLGAVARGAGGPGLT